MTDIVQQTQALDERIIHSLVIDSDLSAMNPHERVAYYVYRCNLLGVDPAEKPFELLKLDGKLVLYASKACANALTRIHGLSVAVLSTSIHDDLITVTARASTPDGRFTDDVAVIDLTDTSVIGGKNKWNKDVSGIGRPNAIMKAVTKAKRRAVLSLVGLGVLDDSEVDSVRGAHRVSMDISTGSVDDDAIDAEVVDELRVSALRDLDAAIGVYADYCGVSKARVFKKLVAKMNTEAASPADLSTGATRVATALIIERIRDLCAGDYADLCKLAPEDFAPDDQARELAAMVGLDVWPEHPTVEQYVAAMDRMAAITSKITAGDDGEDPTGEAAP